MQIHKGTLTFLFDHFQGERCYFTESWDIDAPTAEDAMKRLERIARARAGLLAKNVRIFRLRVPKTPVKEVDMRGFGGDFAATWDRIITRRDGKASKHDLRGVAKEMFTNSDGVTSKGRAALKQFNATLAQCQVVQPRKGRQPEAIGELEMMKSDPIKMGRLKKASKPDLINFLGKDGGQKAWDELKQYRDEQKARLSKGK